MRKSISYRWIAWGLSGAICSPLWAEMTVPELQGQVQTQIQNSQNQALDQDQDRRNGANAAMALGIAGAALAAASCAQLMKAAKETEDPTMKAMLQSKAMEQCAQAAQNAGSAAQNANQKDKLTFDNSPKLAQQNSLPTGEAYTQPEDSGSNTVYVPTAPAENEQVVNPDSAVEPPTSVFEKETLATNTPQAPATGTLNPIGEQIEFDDSVKNPPAAQNTAPGMAPGGMFAAVPTASSLNGTQSTAHPSSEGKDKPSRRVASEEVSSAGSGDSDSSGSGSSGMNALTGLFGETKEPGEDATGQIAQLITAPGIASTASAAKTPNIFEYTSYRIKKSQRDGALKTAVLKATDSNLLAWVKQ